jgi:hypothetical protein
MLRFALSQLDCACGDPRVPSDTFLELIFSPVVLEGLAPPDVLEGTVTVPVAHASDFLDAIAAETAVWDEMDRRKVRCSCCVPALRVVGKTRGAVRVLPLPRNPLFSFMLCCAWCRAAGASDSLARGGCCGRVAAGVAADASG